MSLIFTKIMPIDGHYRLKRRGGHFKVAWQSPPRPTDMSGLPLRHRGAHLPDFVRQLAAVGAGSSDARSVRRELAALHPPPPLPLDAAAPDTAAVFANLAVWVDAAVRASAYHAGAAKLRLYAAFLRVLVRELMPDDRLRACVRQIDAYVTYLMDDEDTGEVVASPTKPAVRPSPGSARDASATSYVPVKMVPAPRHKPMAALLSPRVLQQIRRAEASAGDPQSPHKRPARPTKLTAAQTEAGPRPRTLVELSDHEEAVLELALFFQESVDQLAAAALRSSTTASIDWAARPRAGHVPTTPVKVVTPPTLTSRWLQLSVEAKKRALTGVKRRLSRQKFFSSSDATLKRKPECASSNRTTGERQPVEAADEHRRTGRAVPHTKIEPSRHLTLILLCLHEIIRCTNVFTQELAQFAWLRLCEEPMEAFERALEAVERQRATAFDELQRLRSAKEEMQSAIRECEARIQRLQTRNMASMRLWQLEQREAEHFAREEQWHGHCKALMLRSLTQLAKEVNVPTWCELTDATNGDQRGRGGKHSGEVIDTDGVGSSDDVERDQETIDGEQPRDAGHRSPQPDRLELMGSPRYECLAPGAALLDARLRYHLTYVSHLLILCRSYLHLHERRAARDVVEATATAIEMLGEEAGEVEMTGAAVVVSTASDSPPGSPTSASRLITSISHHELQTLRELSEALRAIEVVYASTMGERPLYIGNGVVSIPGRGSCFHRREAATQFPETLDSYCDGLTSPRAFLRSLAYCTIAATSFAGATSFVPAAIDMTGAYHSSPSDGAASVSSAPAGSGRRRGSAMFKMQGLTIDSSAEPQPPHVMVRLDRAAHKLPKHMKELLLLLEPSPALPPPVLNGRRGPGAVSISPFASASPITGAGYNVAALSGDELVVRIQAIYSQLAQGTSASTSASTSPSWSLPASQASSLQSNLPPPLGISLAGLISSPQSSRSSSAPLEPSALPSPDTLVQEIYALFLDKAEGAVAVTEREFVRFFASIQLFMSKAASSSATPSSAVASRPGGRLATPVCHEIIHLFSILTKLYYLPAPDRGAALVPRRLFELVTYSQRVLDQVALDKKRLQVAGGSAFDIWVAASSSLSSPPPSVLYTADESNCAPPLTPSTPMTPTAGSKRSTPSAPPQPYVLLESAKLLLVHAVGVSTAPSSIQSLEDSARQLETFAAAATVSLANATTPAPYNQVTSSTSSKAAPTGQFQHPNGLLTDAMIVPLQAAVAVVARAWLKRLDELQQPLRVAFRAALKADGGDPSPGKADEGRLTFSEFLHVMTNGQPHSMAVRAPGFSSASPQPWHSTASVVGGDLTYSQLAQLYTAAVSADKPARTRDSAAGGPPEDPSSLLGARWTTLARIVSDELDLTNVSGRFALTDMRSIEHAVVGPLARSGGGGAVATALQDLSTLTSSTRHAVLLPWLLRPPYSNPGEGSASATAAALTKSWTAHRSAMIERFAGAAQAESSAIDGVLSWQSGLQRSRQVDKLVPHHLDEDAVASRLQTVKRDSDGGATSALEGGSRGGGPAGVATDLSSGRKPTAATPAAQHDELSEEQVGVMWVSFYYLQLEHARAHQLVEMADRSAAKQQQQQSTRVQKTTATTMKPPAVTPTSAAQSGSSAPKG